MLKVGERLRISGFPNLLMEITKIVEAFGRHDEDTHISNLEIALRYIDPTARLLDLKLPRIKTVVAGLNNRLQSTPDKLVIKTHDGKLYASLDSKEITAIWKGEVFGDFDEFEEIVDELYHRIGIERDKRI